MRRVQSVDLRFLKSELQKIWDENVPIGLVTSNESFGKSLTQTSGSSLLMPKHLLSWAFRGNTAAAAPSIHVDHNPRTRSLQLGKCFLAAAESQRQRPLRLVASLLQDAETVIRTISHSPSSDMMLVKHTLWPAHYYLKISSKPGVAWVPRNVSPV